LRQEAGLHGSDPPTGTEDREAELLEGCRAGDASAFERLYEAHGARMKSIAANLLGDLSDAEDAVQETFLKIYRGAASFRGGSMLSTWIYRVLVNSCYDLLRKKRLRRAQSSQARIEGSALERPAPAADDPLRLTLEACVAKLDPRRRTAFLLFEVEGFRHREVGEILGIPEGTSKTLLFEARRELQRMLWTSGARAGGAA
jgi:RNA polymerase sigma-70 factor (ECF subfamily)